VVVAFSTSIVPRIFYSSTNQSPTFITLVTLLWKQLEELFVFYFRSTWIHILSVLGSNVIHFLVLSNKPTTWDNIIILSYHGLYLEHILELLDLSHTRTLRPGHLTGLNYIMIQVFGFQCMLRRFWRN